MGTQVTTPISARAAYDKGWDASKRSSNMDAAEDRFRSKYGSDHISDFGAGWSDYAADAEKYKSRPALASATREPRWTNW